MMYRKSQVTLMIILGLVAVIVFGMLAHITGFGEDQRIENRVIKLAEEKVQAAAVEEHVNFCLNKVLDDALILLAGQGGYIHKHQPGSILPWSTIATGQAGAKTVNYTADDKTFEVAYRIERDIKDVTPFYPCETATNPPKYCGFINNIMLYPEVYKHDFGRVKQVFLDYGSFSIMNQLKGYVENETINCIDFSKFHSFDIAAGDINVSLRATDESIAVLMRFPLTIQVPEYYPVIKKYKFVVNKKVRLDKFHDGVNEVLRHDSKYLDFDIKDNTLRGQKIDGKNLLIKQLAVLVERIENWAGFDDLIRITDTSSMVGGRPLTYQFMRANRPPVLDLVRPRAQGQEGAVALPKDYDLIVLIGANIIIEPKAADPDEDNLVYSYGGEYNETLMSSTLWNSPSACNKRCANITFDTKGDYNITVAVTDSQYTDYQIIRIKVEASTTAHASSTEILPGIDSDIASLEDPYILDASSSTLPPQAGSTFEYTWNGGGTSITTENKCIFLPTGEKCSAEPNVNIMDMSGMAKFFGVGSPYGQKPISLTIKEEPGDTTTSPTTFNVKLRECIPYKSNLGIPPYPYHNISGGKKPTISSFAFSEFQGDHTCCLDTYEHAGSGKECFSYTLAKTCYPTQDWQKDITKILGIRPVISDGKGKLTFMGIEEPEDLIIEPPTSTGNYKNDIYTLTLSQKCSDDRGNVCSGTPDFKWERVEECDDIPDPNPNNQVETCEGPPLDSSQCPFNIEGYAKGGYTCTSYEGTTFEKEFLGTGTGACITNEPLCSSLGPGGSIHQYGYGRGGDYLCNATCNERGLCMAAAAEYCFDCNELEQTVYPWIRCEGGKLELVNDDYTCVDAYGCTPLGNAVVVVEIEDECRETFYHGCVIDGNNLRYWTNITQEDLDTFPYSSSGVNYLDIFGRTLHIEPVGCKSSQGEPQCNPPSLANNPGEDGIDNDGDGYDAGCESYDDNPCSKDIPLDNCGGTGCPPTFQENEPYTDSHCPPNQ